MSLREGIGRHYDARQCSHLRSARTRTLAKWLRRDLLKLRRRILRRSLSNPRLRFLSGHYSISPDILERWQDEWLFVTLLRDPVSRFLSHYFYNRYKSSGHFSLTADLDSFLQSERAAGAARLYVDHLGAPQVGEDARPGIDRACRLLDGFALVGVVERIDPFLDAFARKAGFAIDMPRRNVNPAARDEIQAQVTDAHYTRIRELCVADREIYDHALGLVCGEDSSRASANGTPLGR